MSQGIKNFIEELRASDEERKKRYQVLGSASAMCLVVFLWILYLNINIQNVSDVKTVNAEGDAPQNNFFLTMKRGSAILYLQLSDFIWHQVSQKKEIIIEKSAAEENFQSGELVPITPQEIR